MKCMPQKANLSKSQRATLDREIKEELLKLIDKYNSEYDIAVAHALNECSGFGKKRLKRLFERIISNRIELRKFYADEKISDPKIDIFVMEKQLEKKGINLSQIFDEIAKERFDEINELNNHNKKGSVKDER